MSHSKSFPVGVGFIVAMVMSATTSGYGQSVINKIKLENTLSFGFVVVLTYDDNSTQAITLEPESEIVVTAPSSRYITHMKAGIKTVEIPMDPSTQTGWDIPDTPLGTTVYANYRGFLGTFIDPEQGCVVTFSSELL